MANIRKRGKRYTVEVRIAGHPTQTSTFATKGEANAWAVDTERAIRAGQPTGQNAGRIVRDVWDRILERKDLPRWDRSRLTALSRDPVAKRPLHLAGPPDFADWRDRRMKDVASATVRREWALVHSAFKLAMREWHWITLHPMRDLPWPADGKARRRRVSDDEVKLLRVATGYRPDASPDTIIARCGAAFELALETMMRGTEILHITRADLRLPHYVHLPKTKNGDTRDVALSARALAIVEQMMLLGFDPIFGLNAAQKDANFRKAVKRSGLVDLVFHDSRHEAATRLARKLDVLDLAIMGGWRDINELREVYYNPTGEEMAARLNA